MQLLNRRHSSDLFTSAEFPPVMRWSQLPLTLIRKMLRDSSHSIRQPGDILRVLHCIVLAVKFMACHKDLLVWSSGKFCSHVAHTDKSYLSSERRHSYCKSL